MKDSLEKSCREWLKAGRKKYGSSKQATKSWLEKVKVIKFILKLNSKK